jgi:hypothetical protein
MNERIKELAEQCYEDNSTQIDVEKFAELLIRKFSSLLFDESERLYAYSTECDNMRESDDAELVAEKCVDLITMIEHHFGVEE